MRVLTNDEARGFDRWAIEKLGIPALVLMENAALALADAVGDRFPEARRVAIFCGPGNNGGDGLALGRQLVTRGYEVLLVLAAFGRALSNDCSRQLEICQALGLEIAEAGGDWRSHLGAAGRADLIVDALFGTGLSRPLEAPFDALVEALSTLDRPVLAVDLPSGIDAGRERPIGPAVRAAVTVTFGAPKIAHVLYPAAELTGALTVADLGVPFELSPQAEGELHLRQGAELAAALVPRARQAHKGDFGHLLLVAGSPGMGGAAILAARAAVAGGAGKVTVVTAEPHRAALAAAAPEAMMLALGAPPERTSAETLAELLEAAAARDVVALGPGLGQEKATQKWVRDFVARAKNPLVLDADGLNAFAGRAAELARRQAPTVVTPHPGELGRLLGEATETIQNDRLAAVRRARELTGAVVVLKGHRTLVAAPGGEIAILTTGSAALATGGSGDVLTGLLAARLAQGDAPAFAAELAVYLHGAAGDLAVEAGFEPAVPAGTLVEFLPRAYAALAKA